MQHNPIFAQEIRNDKGQLQGRWNGDQFRDDSGRLVYRIDNSGNIRDDAGRLVLRVSGNTFRDSSGRLLGRIDNNGTVRDDAGRQLGRIDEQGRVRDSSGRSIGSSSGNSIEKTAVIFFFRDKI